MTALGPRRPRGPRGARRALLQLAVSLLTFLTSCHGDPIAGPYRVVIEELMACPVGMLDVPFRFNMAAIRDKQKVDMWYMTGNLTMATPFSDALDAQYRLASWNRDRGTWQENAHAFSFPKICSALKAMFPRMFRDLMLVVHAGEEGKECPIAAGTYSVEKVIVDLSSPVIKSFFYGRWRLDARAIESGSKRAVACYRGIFKTVPRRSTG